MVTYLTSELIVHEPRTPKTPIMKQLTILACPLNFVGHVNACMGALSSFTSRGHRVIFILDEVWKGKAIAAGYEEHIMAYEKVTNENDENPGERMGTMLFESKVIGDWTAEEKMLNIFEMFHCEKGYRDMKLYDEVAKEAIERYKPDLIVVDNGVLLPAIYYSGIPWLLHISCMPIMFAQRETLPPGGSGLPSGLDPSEYVHFDKVRQEQFVSSRYNDFIEKLGYDRYPGDVLRPDTQLLTVYGYPDELNYPEIRSLNWFNLEVFDKSHLQKPLLPLDQLVPEKFLNDTLNGNFSGKLIYLSMGSMGAFDLQLMKRLVAVLSTTKHKYIVSKGPRHQEFQLPQNMWGERFLPQLAIVSHCHLVIAHGGNNTTTETFAQGKPMIVLPLFADQYDNAQRIDETGHGIRIDPYQFEDSQLISAIDELLYDEALQIKLQNAAKRIQHLKRHDELVEKVEKLMGENSAK